MNQIKVVEIGSVPSTVGIGGVSIHIQRLLDWIKSDERFRVELFDYKKAIINKKLLSLLRQGDIVHIHVSNIYLRIFYILLGSIFGCKVVVTFHGDIKRYSWLKNQIVKFSLKIANVPIVLNRKSYDLASKWNYKTQIISAFIPVFGNEKLDEDILKLLVDCRNRYEKIVATNAFKRVFTHLGEETYGIDFLVDYFTTKPDYALVISDPSAQYANHYANKQMAENIKLISKPHSFCEVIKRSDFVIRNTSTDGDSLTVREAISLGKPVLATDRVSRPEGTILFKYCDVESLSSAVESINYAVSSTLTKGNSVDGIKALYLNITTNNRK